VKLALPTRLLRTNPEHPRPGRGCSEPRETVTGSGKRSRPQLDRALASLDRGEAAALVVSKIDRLSRSIIAFARMIERSRDNGWKLIALDMGVDFGTPQGKLLGNQLIAFAEYEREIIAARTRDVLRAKRAEGKPISRPTIAPDVVARIRRANRRGTSLSKIAARLDRDGIPTARGGRWRASTVAGVLKAAGDASAASKRKRELAPTV
jgi:DNA invertase Pin-like site-specific DNA recombinase